MQELQQREFRIGDWSACPAQGMLVRGDEKVRIEPKAMEVLAYLVSRPGEVVSRGELEREVWHGALVGYDSVTSTITKLRRAFGDDAKDPQYIATVPKRGYRLVAEVAATPNATQTNSDAPAADALAPRVTDRWRPWAIVSLLGVALLVVAWMALRPGPVQPRAAAIPRTGALPNLVVLPFANLTEDPDQRYLTDGVSEDIIAGLSRLSGLRIIARNSAFAFTGVDTDPREVARQLGVRYVLQGSVQQSGQDLRVTAKLIDTRSGEHLWAEQFNGDTRDLLSLQNRVADRTVTALSVRLTEDERRTLSSKPTTSSEAYHFYLRGRVIPGSMSERESELARSMYRRAIEKDPGFVLAYAGLARTYIEDFRSSRGENAEAAASQALQLAKKAVTLDDNLPQAHFALGYVSLYGRAEHELAIREAERAITLDPNYADAYALLSSSYFFAGELDKTLPLDQEAMRLNPTSSYVYDLHIGRFHYMQGRYRQALEFFQRSAAKNYNHEPTHVWLTATYAKLDNRDEAEWGADQVRTLDPQFTIDEWMRLRPYKLASQRQQLVDGLRAAGLP